MLSSNDNPLINSTSIGGGVRGFDSWEGQKSGADLDEQRLVAGDAAAGARTPFDGEHGKVVRIFGIRPLYPAAQRAGIGRGGDVHARRTGTLPDLFKVLTTLLAQPGKLFFVHQRLLSGCSDDTSIAKHILPPPPP